MNLLDRYIFRSVLFSCALAVALLSFVLMLGNLVKDLLAFALAGQLPLAVFAKLIWLLVPAAATYALPMGILAGVLLTLGRLSADSEIVAMRTAGISLARLARPVLVLAALGSAAALYVNFNSMPKARVEYHEMLDDAIRADPLRLIAPRTFIREFPGYVLYVDAKEGHVMRDFWIWKLDPQGRMLWSAHATEARFDYDPATNELVLTSNARANSEMRDAEAPEDFSKSSWSPTVALKPVRIPLTGIFERANRAQKLKWMTLDELEEAFSELDRDPQLALEPRAKAEKQMEVQLTVQDKLTTGLAVLSFALIGVPLGIKVSRRETSANLGLALLLALSYYMLTVMVWWLDKRPEFRPDLLLWVPNVLFAALGLWLFTRIDKR